jgi:hypothetical protein
LTYPSSTDKVIQERRDMKAKNPKKAKSLIKKRTDGSQKKLIRKRKEK